MARTMQVTVVVGNRVADIRVNEGHEPVVRCTEPYDGNEFAALSCIVETVRAWASGVTIDRYFNPTKSKPEDLVLVLCMWERSGKLTVKDTVPDKKFLHADTVGQAMERKRSFTCYRGLIEQLPKRRERKEEDGS